MKYAIFIVLGLMIVLFGCLDNGTTVSDTGENISTGGGGGGSVVIVSNKTEQSDITGKQNVTAEENRTGGEVPDFGNVKEYAASENGTLFIRMYNISIGGNEDMTRNENNRLTVISKGDFDAAIISVSDRKKDDAVYTVLGNVDDLEVAIFPLVTDGNKDTIGSMIESLKPGYVVLPDRPKAHGIVDPDGGTSTIFVKDMESFTHAGIKFNFINPPLGTDQDRLFDSDNNDAIAIILSDRNFTAVLPNDIRGGGVIKISTKYGDRLKADLVTTPNYGQDVEVDATSLFASKTKPSIVIVEGYRRGAVTKGPDPYETARTAFGSYTKDVTALWNCKYYMLSYDGAEYEGECIEK